MHLSRYHEVTQNPQGRLYQLLLDGPFRRSLRNQIGAHPETAGLVMLRLVPGIPSCIGVPGHPVAFPCARAHMALMFTHTVPEF